MNLKKEILDILVKDAKLSNENIAAMTGTTAAAVEAAIAEMEADKTMPLWSTQKKTKTHGLRLLSS